MLKLKTKTTKLDKLPDDRKQSSLITWGPLASIIVVLLIYISAQLVAALLIEIYPAFKHWDAQETSQWINNSVAAQFWVTVAIEALSLFFIGLFLKKRHSNFKSIGLSRKPKWSDLGYALIGFVVYFGVYYAVLLAIIKAIPQFNVTQKQNIGFSQTSGGFDLVLIFISLVVLPPIIEEILFRGFLYTGLRTKIPKITAALITSLLFASLHLLESNSGLLWIAGIDTFILSLTLVYFREKTDSLYASMGVHMLKNFLAFYSLFLFHVV